MGRPALDEPRLLDRAGRWQLHQEDHRRRHRSRGDALLQVPLRLLLGRGHATGDDLLDAHLHHRDRSGGGRRDDRDRDDDLLGYRSTSAAGS